MKALLETLRDVLKREDREVHFFNFDGPGERISGRLLSVIELIDEVIVSIDCWTGKFRTITVWRREEAPHE